LVLTIACRWGRRHVAHLSRDLDAKPHWTRFHTFVLVERWDPEAARRQQAQAGLPSLRPTPGEPIDVVLDEAKTATRGHTLDAVAKRKDATTDASMRGPQDVGASLVGRGHVIPFGLRLSVTHASGPAFGRSCRKTTPVAAQLMRACKAPPGVQVIVLGEASSLGTTVVQACREPQGHCASPLTRHRRLLTRGWQRTAGRSGRTLLRRRRTDTLDLSKPEGQVHERCVEAG